jgi:hypothetical protein
MRFSSWLSLGIGAGVMFAAACGGSVSLGTIGGELGADGGGTSSSGGSSSGSSGGTATECKDKSLCGPALGMPNYLCSDGSQGGPTGRCLQQPNGSCGWEVRSCPDADAGPAPTDCFDTEGKLLDSFKACKTAEDCVAHQYQANCCGTDYAAGVATSQLAAAKKCTDDRAATFPGCGCATMPTGADDGTTAADFTGKAQVTCHNDKCETTFKGETCGKYVCTATQTCCGPMPLPEATCVDGASSPCPISQRKMKKDILYLSDGEKEQLSSELMAFPLATYRYKTEGNEQKPHLGFIIDDVAPSPAVLQSGERVDLYGYSTMTVAALQVQAKEIAELKKQMDDLKKECASKKSAAKK